MYSGNNNKLVSSLDNTITVTPIKMDVDMSHAYPTTSNALSTAAATSMRATNTISVMTNAASTATSKEKSSKQPRVTVHKTPPTIDNFWPNIVSEVKNIQQVDAKHQALPLARIKKIMKLDENAKMIAAEAPLLFAKACEYFIQELTMRAWVHTEDNKRRTLQRSDIAQAIANYDQFDFLIDIVPREDIKPSSSSSSNAASQNTKKDTQPPAPAATSVSTAMPTNTIKLETPQMLSYGTLTSDALAAAAQQQLQQQPTQQLQILQQTASPAQPQQLQYFITIPGQQHGQHQLVQQLQLQQPQLQQQLPNGLTLTTTAGNPQLAGLNIVTPQPQQLILTAGPNGQLTATPAPTAATTQQQQQTALLQNLAHQHHQQQQQQQQLGNQQQIQLLHQVISPTGELTNVLISITANQLNLLRLQMQQQQQQQQQHQQVIIPAHCVNAGAAQQMLQLGAGGNVAAAAPNANANTNATIQLGQVQITHYPQQQQQQQQQQQHQQQQQQQQQHQQQQHQQQQNSASGGPNIYLNTGQQQNPNSVVSTDRNLNSTYRTNC